VQELRQNIKILKTPHTRELSEEKSSLERHKETLAGNFIRREGRKMNRFIVKVSENELDKIIIYFIIWFLIGCKNNNLLA
jgi:hypothetical protein